MKVRQWEIEPIWEKGTIQIVARGYRDNDGSQTDMGTTRYFTNERQFRQFLRLFKMVTKIGGKSLYKAKSEGWYVIK